MRYIKSEVTGKPFDTVGDLVLSTGLKPTDSNDDDTILAWKFVLPLNTGGIYKYTLSGEKIVDLPDFKDRVKLLLDLLSNNITITRNDSGLTADKLLDLAREENIPIDDEPGLRNNLQ